MTIEKKNMMMATMLCSADVDDLISLKPSLLEGLQEEYNRFGEWKTKQ